MKLDGVGPVDNRPSTDKLHHFVWRRRKKCYMWHVTHDMWHVTRDTWHVTRDTWHVTYLGGWTFSQNFSCLALTVCDLWYYEYLEEKGSVAESVIDEAVHRTAPATPGLLITVPSSIRVSGWSANYSSGGRREGEEARRDEGGRAKEGGGREAQPPY